MAKILAPVALALLLSHNLLTIFSHGLLGLGSAFTGASLVALMALLTFEGARRPVLIPSDRLTLAFASACAVSTALRPPADMKSLALLGLSVAAYAASRGLAGVMMQRAFIITLGAIVWIGALLLALAMDATSAKPVLFGFDHGAVQVASLLGLLVFALACSPLRLWLVAAIGAPPLAILAAAQVRLALVAAVACLALGAMIGRDRLRMRLGVFAAVALIAIAAGALARKSMTMEQLRYAGETLDLKPVPHGLTAPIHIPGEMSLRVPAPDCPDVNLNNSLDMRKRLYAEALALLPSAGPFGIGLGTFAEISCIKAEVHNQVLQTALELGWIAGALLIALIAAAALPLFLPARKSPRAMLALLSLAYAVLLALAAGRITDGLMLFVMIGYAAGSAAKSPIA